MNVKLETLCLGHITQGSKKCVTCKNDEYNKQCKNYHEVGLYIVEIPSIIDNINFMKYKKSLEEKKKNEHK